MIKKINILNSENCMNYKKCKVNDCYEESLNNKGFCSSHYRSFEHSFFSDSNRRKARFSDDFSSKIDEDNIKLENWKKYKETGIIPRENNSFSDLVIINEDCENSKSNNYLNFSNEDKKEEWRNLLDITEFLNRLEFNINANNLNEEKLDISEFKKIDGKILVQEELGRGAFGVVNKGLLNNNPVAIKRFNFSLNQISSQELYSFLEELKILERIFKKNRSKYIIEYYGIDVINKNLNIVMELANFGDLSKFIKDNVNNSNCWKLNGRLILHMTRGLMYLHAGNILHRDLKSLNILISYDENGYNAKLTDFGISKIVNNLSVVKTRTILEDICGTYRWLAPEILINKKNHSKYSDIYSLGMIIWEIASKKTIPFEEFNFVYEIPMHYIKGGREKIPNNSPQEIREIIQNCWKEIPEERIKLEEIETKLIEFIDRKENSNILSNFFSFIH